MPTIPKRNRPAWVTPTRKAWEHPNRWDGYKRNKWKEFSYYFKLAHPICATPGCNNATYYTDHIDPEDKYKDPLNPAKCQPLCYQCGNRKSGHESAEAYKARQAEAKND